MSSLAADGGGVSTRVLPVIRSEGREGGKHYRSCSVCPAAGSQQRVPSGWRQGRTSSFGIMYFPAWNR